MKRVLSSKKSALLLVGTTLISCYRKPEEERQSFRSVEVDHSSFTQECTECHEVDRPTLLSAKSAKDKNDSDFIHGQKKPCSLCHEYDQEKPWKTISYSHPSNISTCLSCHETTRPKPESHPKEGDCIGCHATDSWTPK